MKKAILFLSFIAISASLVNAQIANDSIPAKQHYAHHSQQQNFKSRMVAKKVHKRMQELNITKEQKAQLKTINDNYQKQLLQLEGNDAITLGEYKNKVAELKKDRKAQMQNVFTDQQKQKLADAKKRMDINRQVMATAHLERMKLTLGLNDEQVAKIKEQQKSLQTQMKDIRENDMLLPEQKRNEIKQLVLQHRDDVKSVLTEDQQKMLDQRKNDLKNRINERRQDLMGR